MKKKQYETRMSFFGEIGKDESEWEHIKKNVGSGVSKLEKRGIRRSDLYRGVAVLLILVILYPSFIAPRLSAAKERAKQREYDERWEYYTKNIEEKRKKIGLESMSYDERFAYYVKEKDPDVINVAINDTVGIIYIYLPTNGGDTEEAWQIRMEYQKAMADIAASSHVEKEIWLMGVDNGVCVWTITGDGTPLNDKKPDNNSPINL